MSRSQATNSVQSLALAAWVATHAAMPNKWIAVLASPLRVPVLFAAAAALAGAAAAVVASVHLWLRAAPEAETIVIVLVAALPAVRLAFGATPPLVTAVQSVSGLLRALDLGATQRVLAALLAGLPLLSATVLVATGASLSLWTAGDAPAAFRVATAAACGVLLAAAIAIVRSGRPFRLGLVSMVVTVAVAGTAVLCTVSMLVPSGITELARLAERAMTAELPIVAVIAAVAVMPALWLAAEILVLDTRALVRLLRELVSCGVRPRMLELSLLGGVLFSAGCTAPAAAAAAIAIGQPQVGWTAIVVAMHVVCTASVVGLLEPDRERAIARAIAIALLGAPAVAVCMGMLHPVVLPIVSVVIAAIGARVAVGGSR